MIAVDTQLLVYAHRGELPSHTRALEALRGLACSNRAWAIPWPCVHEFLGTVTRRRLFNPPSTLLQAFEALERWSKSPGLCLIGEGQDHLRRLRTICEAGAISGPIVHDARIAAICLSHGVGALWTSDRDFSRFPDLKTVNPLVPPPG